jgi:hypothetical protein
MKIGDFRVSITAIRCDLKEDCNCLGEVLTFDEYGYRPVTSAVVAYRILSPGTYRRWSGDGQLFEHENDKYDRSPEACGDFPVLLID